MVIIKENAPTNYQAIACALHSEYERAILRQKFTTICWKGVDNVLHQEILMPYDLSAQAGEEFLLARAKGNALQKIRLDYIISINNEDFEK